METTTPRKFVIGSCLAAALLLCLPAATAQAAPKPPPGACHALLLGGMPGTAIHARHYRDWLKRFRRYLVRTAGVPAGNVVVLSGDKAFKDPIVNGLATAKTIGKSLADKAKTVRPGDQFILFMVGLGVTTEKPPTFVIPGPDVSAGELADGLAEIRATNQVVLNFSAGSGDSVPAMSQAARVVVAANMPTETNPPVYAELFLRGLESKRADGEGAPEAGKADGVITVLEAYNWAAHQTAQWIARQTKSGEDLWRVDGAESVEIFRKLYVSTSGESGSRKLDPASDAGAPDRTVKLKMRGEGDMEIAESRRRMIGEHAGLEDCGAGEPVSALGDEKKDYVPLRGVREGEPGCLARRVVLGSAALLPAKGS